MSGRTAGGRILADETCGLQVCQGTVAGRLGDSRKGEQRARLGLVVGAGLAMLGVVLAAAGAATA